MAVEKAARDAGDSLAAAKLVPAQALQAVPEIIAKEPEKFKEQAPGALLKFVKAGGTAYGAIPLGASAVATTLALPSLPSQLSQSNGIDGAAALASLGDVAEAGSVLASFADATPQRRSSYRHCRRRQRCSTTSTSLRARLTRQRCYGEPAVRRRTCRRRSRADVSSFIQSHLDPDLRLGGGRLNSDTLVWYYYPPGMPPGIRSRFSFCRCVHSMRFATGSACSAPPARARRLSRSHAVRPGLQTAACHRQSALCSLQPAPEQGGRTRSLGP